MIAVIPPGRSGTRQRRSLARAVRRRAPAKIATLATALAIFVLPQIRLAAAGEATPPVPRDNPPPPAADQGRCLASGDGYFRAHIGGAIDAHIDWPNSGTRCQGEPKSKPTGIRLSFQRSAATQPNFLFVFGITGVREGQPAQAAGVNLTVIQQGTPRIYGTLGDSRCTVDSLTQKPMAAPRAYRVEARGFCTQPAHAVRGDGDVLVSTFEFAGLVQYDADEHAEVAASR